MKKIITTLSIFLSAILILLSFTACGGGMQAPNEQYAGGMDFLGTGTISNSTADAGGALSEIIENPFVSVEEKPISTFSADVDTASYAYFRKLVEQGYSLESLKKQLKNSPLRSEEMVNYFDYAVALPSEGELFGVQATVANTPWSKDTHLMMMTLATEQAEVKGENNLVFLIDVSGSMRADDKLPLLQKAFATLVSSLDENDTVSIVTYSGKEETVLAGCPGNRDEEIMAAINSLSAYGSTNGESGLTRAYSVARDYYKEGGNNRIIMASDGDLNVGISSPEELKAYISGKRNEGIYLSVMGFGTGNYNDSTMSALAQNGNGVYYYIDSEREAEKVLGDDLLSTLYTVAKDVKLQLTFDGTSVEQYRLIGYETRMLNTEDFEDDTKDAGEVGAGHTVTVCYELVLCDGVSAENASRLASLDIRYKLPSENESILRSFELTSSCMTSAPSADFHFASAVIEAVMILNDSRLNADRVGLDHVLELLDNASVDGDIDRAQFKALIQRLNTPMA